jgi:hypothetical protein
VGIFDEVCGIDLVAIRDSHLGPRFYLLRKEGPEGFPFFFRPRIEPVPCEQVRVYGVKHYFRPVGFAPNPGMQDESFV